MTDTERRIKSIARQAAEDAAIAIGAGRERPANNIRSCPSPEIIDIIEKHILRAIVKYLGELDEAR